MKRLAGADRYATSRAIAGYGAWEQTTFIATGRDFPDALASGPIAGRWPAPVLLVDGKRSSLDSATLKAINDSDSIATAIIGGPGAVSGGIEKQVKSLQEEFLRVAGADRYQTAAKLNSLEYADGYTTAYLAVGTGFADALAGGGLASRFTGPLYLVQRDCVPGVVLDQLKSEQPSKIVLLGGKGVLTDNVAKLKRCA